MKIKTFVKKIDKIISDSGEFVAYSKHSDMCFFHMEENEIVVSGQDSDCLFCLTVSKVEYDKKER